MKLHIASRSPDPVSEEIIATISKMESAAPFELMGTFIENVEISKASFTDVSFEELDLANVLFKGCHFSRVELNGITMKDGGFEACSIESSEFIKSHLIDTTFSNVIFEQCRFSRAEFRRAQFANASFGNSDLSFASFSGCDLRGVDFSTAVLESTYFFECEMDDSLIARAGVVIK